MLETDGCHFTMQNIILSKTACFKKVFLNTISSIWILGINVYLKLAGLFSHAQLQKQLKWNHVTYSIPTEISLLNEEIEPEQLPTCNLSQSTEAFHEVHFYKLLKWLIETNKLFSCLVKNHLLM